MELGIWVFFGVWSLIRHPLLRRGERSKSRRGALPFHCVARHGGPGIRDHALENFSVSAERIFGHRQGRLDLMRLVRREPRWRQSRPGWITTRIQQPSNPREIPSLYDLLVIKTSPHHCLIRSPFQLYCAALMLSGRILIPPPTYAARRKGTQRLRCSIGRCSRRGSLKAAFRWWYQDVPFASHDRILTLTCAEDDSNVQNSCVISAPTRIAAGRGIYPGGA